MVICKIGKNTCNFKIVAIMKVKKMKLKCNLIDPAKSQNNLEYRNSS